MGYSINANEANALALRSNLENIDQGIFRAYDIRGIVGKSLNAELVHDIGLAIGSESRDHGEDTICVARDGRLSGPSLHQALIEGLMASGCKVKDCGMVPTPVLYFATHTTGATSGVMLTGSHNPKDHNGLKIVIGNSSLTGDAIMRLYWRIRMGDIKKGAGECEKIDVLDAYYNYICKDIKLDRPLKVVVDAGNGVGGVTAQPLLEKLGAKVIPLCCEVDGNFPVHHPDPSKEANLVLLKEAMEEHQADIGFALDGDADRLGIVTPKGEVIWPDRQLMFFAQAILAKNPGKTVIYDVKCSAHVEKIIEAAKGEPLMYKTGHSLVKTKMKAINAIFAGEMSGHLFFNDRWFGFDDGMYTAARMLEILASSDQDADTLFDAIPNSHCTPELNVAIAEEKKFTYIEELIAKMDFPQTQKITIDGVRVQWQDGWALVRASNTTANLVVRFEADSDEVLKRIMSDMRQLMQDVDSSLSLDF